MGCGTDNLKKYEEISSEIEIIRIKEKHRLEKRKLLDKTNSTKKKAFSDKKVIKSLKSSNSILSHFFEKNSCVDSSSIIIQKLIKNEEKNNIISHLTKLFNNYPNLTSKVKIFWRKILSPIKPSYMNFIFRKKYELGLLKIEKNIDWVEFSEFFHDFDKYFINKLQLREKICNKFKGTDSIKLYENYKGLSLNLISLYDSEKYHLLLENSNLDLILFFSIFSILVSNKLNELKTFLKETININLTLVIKDNLFKSDKLLNLDKIEELEVRLREVGLWGNLNIYYISNSEMNKYSNVFELNGK